MIHFSPPQPLFHHAYKRIMLTTSRTDDGITLEPGTCSAPGSSLLRLVSCLWDGNVDVMSMTWWGHPSDSYTSTTMYITSRKAERTTTHRRPDDRESSCCHYLPVNLCFAWWSVRVMVRLDNAAFKLPFYFLNVDSNYFNLSDKHHIIIGLCQLAVRVRNQPPVICKWVSYVYVSVHTYSFSYTFSACDVHLCRPTARPPFTTHPKFYLLFHHRSLDEQVK